MNQQTEKENQQEHSDCENQSQKNELNYFVTEREDEQNMIESKDQQSTDTKDVEQVNSEGSAEKKQPIQQMEQANNNLSDIIQQEVKEFVQEEQEQPTHHIITQVKPELIDQDTQPLHINLETLMLKISSSSEQTPRSGVQDDSKIQNQNEQQRSLNTLQENEDFQQLNILQIKVKEKDQRIFELQQQNTKYFQQIKGFLDNQIKIEKSKNIYKEQIKDLKRNQQQLQPQLLQIQNENKKLKAEKDYLIKQNKDELNNLLVQLDQKKKEIYDKNAYIMLLEERMKQQQQIIDLHNEETRQFFELNQEIKSKNQEIEFLRKKFEIIIPQNRGQYFYQPIAHNPEQYKRIKNDIDSIKQNQSLMSRKISRDLNLISKNSSISPIQNKNIVKNEQQTRKYEQQSLKNEQQYPTFRTPNKQQFPLYSNTEPNNLILINDERQDTQALEEVYKASLDRSYTMLQKNQHLLNINPLLKRDEPLQKMKTFTKNSRASFDFRNQEQVEDELSKLQSINNYNGDQLGLMRHGFGKQIYPNDNSIYEGEWKFDKRHGAGILCQQNGNLIYDGQWENDMMHGFGKLMNMFKTHNKNNMLDDWMLYEGNFKKNQFQGKGTMILRNGDKYDGDFENNLAEGEGILLKTNGEQIRGQWARGSLIQLPKPNVQEI